MPVVSLCSHFSQLCSQGRSDLVRSQLLYKDSVLSSLVLFILRCVYADLGEHMLHNITSKGGVNSVTPVPQAEVPEPEIGASCNNTSGHLRRGSEFTSLGPSRRATGKTNVS